MPRRQRALVLALGAGLLVAALVVWGSHLMPGPGPGGAPSGPTASESPTPTPSPRAAAEAPPGAPSEAPPAEPPAEPAPAPSATEPAPPKAEEAPKSIQGLEAQLAKKPAALLAMLVLRFGLLALGIVFLVLAWDRRRAVARGELPPRLPPRAPVVPSAPLPAILLVLGTYVAVSLLGPALVAWRPDLAGSTVGGMLAMAIPAVAASLYVLARRRRARLEAGVGPTPRRRAVRAGAWTFCVASAVVVPATLAWVWFLHRVGVETDAQQAVLDAVEGPISHAWLITIYGVLLAPFTEEVIFRGLLHPSLRPTLGRRGATLGVALLFALVHVNAHALVPLFVLALFLGWLLEETDSLLATFTVHALFNASSLLPILLFRYT